MNNIFLPKISKLEIEYVECKSTAVNEKVINSRIKRLLHLDVKLPNDFTIGCPASSNNKLD